MHFTAKMLISLAMLGIVTVSGSYISSKKVNNPFANSSLSDQEKAQLASKLKPELVKGLDSIAERFQERHGLSASIMVNYKGYKIFEEAYGTESPNSDKPLSTNNRYQLASVSKQFTAFAVLMLVDDGMLNLSDTVQKHIPYFPYERITVEQLLTHTAGLPNYMWAVEHHWDKNSAPYNDEVLKLMDSLDLNLYFRPGTRFFYANTGYISLAQVVEKVSGKRYDSFLQERIFEPLNMNKAFVYSEAWDRTYPDHLKGFSNRGYYSYKVKNNDLDGAVGDKGIYATTSDLYKWDQALYEGKLIADSLLNKAFQQTILLNANKINYGFGFRLEKLNGKPVAYHNGLWHGFRTSFKRYITDSISLVVLNNTNSRKKGMLVNRLENYLDKHSDAGELFELVFQKLNARPGVSTNHHTAAKNLNPANSQKLRQAIRYLRVKRLQEPAEELMQVYKQNVSDKRDDIKAAKDPF